MRVGGVRAEAPHDRRDDEREDGQDQADGHDGTDDGAQLGDPGQAGVVGADVVKRSHKHHSIHYIKRCIGGIHGPLTTNSNTGDFTGSDVGNNVHTSRLTLQGLHDVLYRTGGDGFLGDTHQGAGDITLALGTIPDHNHFLHLTGAFLQSDVEYTTSAHRHFLGGKPNEGDGKNGTLI
ncbi:MAG: hypothetical protein BWY72_00205 [Bacteroidetes bacterium ADurb.Bin416]|nr:MAG: hypothetical protein BWY72_00205 [Bacteroidetes bacterium ADurb.Bin416]